jgi:hypothetical protein
MRDVTAVADCAEARDLGGAGRHAPQRGVTTTPFAEQSRFVVPGSSTGDPERPRVNGGQP